MTDLFRTQVIHACNARWCEACALFTDAKAQCPSCCGPLVPLEPYVNRKLEEKEDA
jgi:hypothetical protein